MSEEYRDNLCGYKTTKDLYEGVDKLFLECEKPQSSELITEVTTMMSLDEGDVSQHLSKMSAINTKL